MKKNQWTRIWGLSLFVMSVCTLCLIVSKLIGFELPDVVIRIVGTIELVALAIFSFATVRKYKEEKEHEKNFN